MIEEIINTLQEIAFSKEVCQSYSELSPNTYYVYLEDINKEYKIRIENSSNNRKSLMCNEAESIKYLEKLKVNFKYPEYLLLKKDKQDKYYSIQEYISGLTISSIENEELRYKYYFNIGEYLSKLHKIPNYCCGRIFELKNISWYENFMVHLKSDSEEIKNIISESILNDLDKKIVLNKRCFFISPKYLHGDPHPGNMIVDKESDKVSMIDFQHCLFGDPIFEIGQFYIRITRYEKNIFLALHKLVEGMKIVDLNLELLDIYIYALFINEIAFAYHIGKTKSVEFYRQKFYEYLDTKKD